MGAQSDPLSRAKNMTREAQSRGHGRMMRVIAAHLPNWAATEKAPGKQAHESAMRRAPLADQRGRRHRAKIVLFPLGHQRPLVVKLAARMAAEPPAHDEKLLGR